MVVDAGHGGKATGAKGFYNLVEKDVTLDISKKLKVLLEKEGYKVHLTRDSDQDISLIDRCRQAEILDADLFISVHANSAGKKESPNGIETFHLNSTPLISRDNSGLSKFYFLNNNEDKKLASLSNVLAKSNENLSQKFAGSIQSKLVDCIKNKNMNVKNRGVKKSCFLVLLGLMTKLSLPTALVEVGFITNRDEARRLSSHAYRTLVAEGIAKGIKSFLKNG